VNLNLNATVEVDVVRAVRLDAGRQASDLCRR